MRCFIVTSLLVVFLSVPVLGQPLPTPQVQVHPSAGQRKAVPIPQKLRYLCKQLNLDEKQWQHAEGLFAILEDEQNMGPGQLRELLEQIRAITQEREAAREAGDQERVKELNQQLKGLAPGSRAKNNFIKGLLPALNEEQKVKLNVLLKRLENVTNLELKPIQVVRAARELELNADQQRQFKELVKQFRTQIAPNTKEDVLGRSELLEKLITDIAAILDAEQRARFEREIDTLRPDTPAPAEPGAEPAVKPAGP